MKMESIFRTSSTESIKLSAQGKTRITPEPEKIKVALPPPIWASLAGPPSNNNETLISNCERPQHTTNVYVNGAGQRIDRPLPQPSQAVLATWIHKIKKANMRYCRMYQLDGHCVGKCDYSHGPLTDGEKDAYRLDLRSQMCDAKMACRSEKCHYRHNCFCSKKKCKFAKEMHGVDQQSAVPWVS